MASYDINGNDADPFPRFVKVFFFQEKSQKAYKAYFCKTRIQNMRHIESEYLPMLLRSQYWSIIKTCFVEGMIYSTQINMELAVLDRF